MSQTRSVPELPDEDDRAALALAAFDKGKALFVAQPCDVKKMLRYWQKALPSHEDAINNFILDQGQVFLKDFLNEEGDDIHWSLSSPDNVWSDANLSTYYQRRNDSERFKKITEQRRQLYRNGMPCTELDDYQTQRDKDRLPEKNQRKMYEKKLNILLLLSESIVVIYPSVKKETYVVEVLLKLLNCLHLQLPDATSSMLTQLDAINTFAANYFVGIIAKREVERHKDLLKQALNYLGALGQEIFPWLTIHFKSMLLTKGDGDGKLIKEFLKFHALRKEYSLPANPTWINSLLKRDKWIWDAINNHPCKNKWQRIREYQWQDLLSDSVALKICVELIADCETHGNKIAFAITAFTFIERIKRDRYYLSEAYRYIEKQKEEMQSNLFFAEKLKLHCPTLYICIMWDTPNEMLASVYNLKYLPPIAKLFHAHMDRVQTADLTSSPPATSDLMGGSQITDFLPSILSDPEYNFINETFLLSADACVLGVIIEDYPIWALRLHYAKKRDVSNVKEAWVKVLESDILFQNNFFAFADNMELFYNLRKVFVTKFLPPAETILQSPTLYRNLATALTLYMACLLRNDDPDSEYHTKTHWAAELYYALLKRVAFIGLDDENIQFANIIKFLDLKLNTPVNLTCENIWLSVQDAAGEFYTANPEIYPAYQHKLLHSFMRMYRINHATRIDPIRAYPLTQLPAVCINWLEVFLLEQLIVIPPFASRFAVMQSKVNTQNKNTEEKVYKNLAELFGPVWQTRYDGELSLPVDLRIAITFTLQIYYHYCKQNFCLPLQPDNANSYYYNFMLNYEIPMPVTEAIHNLVSDIEKVLTQASAPRLLERLKFANLTPQKEHLQKLKDQLKLVYANLMDAKHLINLLNLVGGDIWKNTFNSNWVLANPYHTFLTLLNASLLDLQCWQKLHAPACDAVTVQSHPHSSSRIQKLLLKAACKPLELKDEEVFVPIKKFALLSPPLSSAKALQEKDAAARSIITLPSRRLQA
jgi:hypothetical protein